MDPLDILKGLMPIAGALIGGPAGAAGLSYIANKIGVKEATVTNITNALQGISPLELKQLEQDLLKWNIEQQNAMEVARLKDVSDARARDVEIRKAGQHNYRADWIVGVTFVGILACVSIAVGMSSLNEFGKTCVNVVLGVLIADWKQITSFEFGSSKSSQTKDATINNLSQG